MVVANLKYGQKAETDRTRPGSQIIIVADEEEAGGS